MIPFGPKLNTVFASRWKALIWSGVVLLTAYCAVPSAEQTAEADVKAETSRADEAAARNPWALDQQ